MFSTGVLSPNCPKCNELCWGPLIVTCGHVMCRRCLRHLLSQKESNPLCPVCSKAVTLPSDSGSMSVTDMLHTFLADPILEIIVDDEQGQRTEYCKVCDAYATKICLDCREMYCMGCSTVHERMAVSSDHKQHDLPYNFQEDPSSVSWELSEILNPSGDESSSISSARNSLNLSETGIANPSEDGSNSVSSSQPQLEELAGDDHNQHRQHWLTQQAQSLQSAVTVIKKVIDQAAEVSQLAEKQEYVLKKYHVMLHHFTTGAQISSLDRRLCFIENSSKLECLWMIRQLCNDCFPELSLLASDTLLDLKPCQLRMLNNPLLIMQYKRRYPGLDIIVDDLARTARVRASVDIIEGAFSDFRSLVSETTEHKIEVGPQVLMMYSKAKTQEWIQGLLEKKNLVCLWEVCENYLLITGCSSDLPTIERIFKKALSEVEINLGNRDTRVLRSEAWQQFLDKLAEEDRGEFPTPLLVPFPEEGKVIVSDTPAKLGDTRRKLQEFLEEYQVMKETVPIDLHRLHFLEQFCQEDRTELVIEAGNAGVAVTFGYEEAAAEGPKAFLCSFIRRVKQMVRTIKKRQLVFNEPGQARYLTESIGQLFLKQTEQDRGCFIVTKCSRSTEKLEDQNDTACGGSSSRSEVNVTDVVDVYVLSRSNDAVNSACSDISARMRDIIVSRTETDHRIQKLSEQQMNLFTLKNSQTVRVEFDKDQSSVTFIGIHTEVATTGKSLQDFLLCVEPKVDFDTKLPPEVSWQHEESVDEFVDFDLKTARIIEAAFQKNKPKVEFFDRHGRQFMVIFRTLRMYPIGIERLQNNWSSRRVQRKVQPDSNWTFVFH